jgi:hypothetical protein
MVQCEESITGLEGGRVGNALHPEVVVATYTGWIFGLTTEPVYASGGGDEGGGGGGGEEAAPEAPQMEVKVQQMRLVPNS